LPEPAATISTLAQSTDRVYFIERFYSLVAGATDDRLCLAFREDLNTNANHAAYACEAWLEGINGREEKYDRLANLARAISPITDLLRELSADPLSVPIEELVANHERVFLNSIRSQRNELRQCAGEAAPGEFPVQDDDPLNALLTVVATPDGRDDFVAWFQIGWLYWKRNVYDEAENAFRTAASFSQRQSPWYFSQSLRHESFMQWLRGNTERARSTVRRAIDVRRDPHMLVEAARYSISASQDLEAQYLIDEALQADPLIFVSVLADPVFANSMTSMVDVLTRQQLRAHEAADAERQEWEGAISVIRQAEKFGSLKLLPDSADSDFAANELSSEPDLPMAVLRSEQAKSYRLAWVAHAATVVEKDVERRTKATESAEREYRAAEQAQNSKLNSIDTEQRIAELVVQDEHDSAPLPVVPQLKDEMMNGFTMGLGVLVAGGIILACFSQWLFGSIPPLQPIPGPERFLAGLIVLAMIVFGLFGFVSFPLLRLRKAKSLYDDAARSAEFDADQKLRTIANDATRQREEVRQDWLAKRNALQSAVDEAQIRQRASISAHTALKRIPDLEK
jgi:tetratricopeptide (TPR) repeat protein